MFAMTIYQLIIPPTTTNGVAKNRYEDVCRKIQAVDCEQSLIFFKVAVERTNKRFQCQTHHVWELDGGLLAVYKGQDVVNNSSILYQRCFHSLRSHRQPKLTSRERIRLIISGVRAGTWLFNESGIGLHGGREFIKDLYGNPRYRFRKINTRRNSQ